MNSMLSPLEEQRLGELKQIVTARAADLAGAPGGLEGLGDALAPSGAAGRPGRPVPLRRRYARAGVLAGTAAAAAAAAVLAATVLAPGGASPSAHGGAVQHAQLDGYSITRADDGVVTIEFDGVSHLDDLAAQLRADDIPAFTAFVPAGKVCVEAGAAFAPDSQINYKMPDGVYSLPRAVPGRHDAWRMQINPAHIKPGESLIFGVTTYRITPAGRVSMPPYGTVTYLVTGTVTACHFVPAPPFKPAPLPPAPNGPRGQKGAGFVMLPTSWFQIGPNPIRG